MVGERSTGRLPGRDSIGLESVDSSMEFFKVKIPEVRDCCKCTSDDLHSTIMKDV